MKPKYASNGLKVLLILFGVGVAFVGVYVLPIMALQMTEAYPEIAYAKTPILIISELLLILLLIGIATILYLLKVFDKGKTFTSDFTKGLTALVLMCLVAALGVFGIFMYTSSLGGPDPLSALIMIGAIFVILIVGSVILLVKTIVKESITYKTDYDLTV
ncbi:MAG: DUF2975 domain-containing protein [Erysipelothrix sp.]|nr:DUF2975 domain-containing protein [Erysipelothrix sp.]